MQEASEQISYAQGTVLVPVKADALEPDERSCCICLQPFGSATLTQSGSEAAVQLPCGHVFGEVCMASWALVNNSCPLCRKQAFSFGIGDHSAGQHSSDPRVSIPLSSVLLPQDDIWLDEYVWNDSNRSRRSTVSSADIETMIYSYTHDHSDVNLGSQRQHLPGTLSCSEHRGFCQCSADQNTRNGALPHRRLATPATAPREQTDIVNLDLVQLGSQFAELQFQYPEMDGFLNASRFGQNTLLEEVFPPVDTDPGLGDTARHNRH